jgi:hypothetical protein
MLVGTAAVFLVPLALFSGLFTGSFMVGYLDFMESLVTTLPDATSEVILGQFLPAALGLSGLSLLIALVGVLLNGLVALALTVHSIAYIQGDEHSFGRGIRLAMSRFWAYLGMNILRGLAYMTVGVIVLGTMLLLFVGFGLLIGGAGLMAGSDAGGLAMAGIFIAVICGYLFALLLIFLPIAYLSARWAVVIPGMIDQKLGPVSSLSTSWRLSSGNIWRCLGYVVLLTLLGAIVFTVPLSLVQQVLLIIFPDLIGPITGASAALASIFSILWQPFYVASFVLLYFDLRVRAESYDLDLRLRQLESEQQEQLPSEASIIS